ncbi:SRPBCC family protein [Microbacterium hominis]|uniref:SRPBCC family protein n=1 Tax=Microbacterium hominis TaxID=162426 RepID=A0A7D4TPC3_9MICO|nr:SRPBCC family protein [Microbacterium hominis]QKJ20262.1 SRPBCC family protein [Microbacterium hominis]
MDLESSFTVEAPVEEVWQAVMDIERVATCVPGAEITEKLSETSYQGVVKVKVGPLTMQYRGVVELISRDDENHVAVLQGKAQEKAGQGTAQGTATLTLVEADGVTTGTVVGSIALSGKVAAMGRGIIDKVAQQIMGIFAGNLQAMISGEDGEGSSGGGSVNGLSVMAGAIGSMFHRDKSAKADSGEGDPEKE